MLKYDIRELAQLRKQLGGSAPLVEKALNRAVDVAARKAATHISRDVRRVYAVKAGTIKRTLKIQRVRRDAPRALLYTGRRLPLEKFSPRHKMVRVSATSSRGKTFQTRRRGATVRVRKDSGRKLVRGGWYAKNHILRRANADDPNSQPRIQVGPSIPGMVAHPSTIEGAEKLVREVLPGEFNDRLEHLLSEKVGLT